MNSRNQIFSYRKYFKNHYGHKVPKDWDVHHIDFDHNNNHYSNLIALPRAFHRHLHNKYGYAKREEINSLLEEYLKGKKFSGVNPNNGDEYSLGVNSKEGFQLDFFSDIA